FFGHRMRLVESPVVGRLYLLPFGKSQSLSRQERDAIQLAGIDAYPPCLRVALQLNAPVTPLAGARTPCSAVRACTEPLPMVATKPQHWIVWVRATVVPCMLFSLRMAVEFSASATTAIPTAAPWTRFFSTRPVPSWTTIPKNELSRAMFSSIT